MSSLAELNHRLNQIHIEIEEAKQRLGAHSVKPVLMAALFELEDERDTILNEIAIINSADSQVKP